MRCRAHRCAPTPAKPTSTQRQPQTNSGLSATSQPKSLAIHAAINAADAVCGARLGQRAAGEDHEQVLTLLKQAGTDGTAVEKELRRLLPLKTKTEYEPDDVAPSIATKAVERAKRCVTVARSAANAMR